MSSSPSSRSRACEPWPPLAPSGWPSSRPASPVKVPPASPARCATDAWAASARRLRVRSRWCQATRRSKASRSAVAAMTRSTTWSSSPRTASQWMDSGSNPVAIARTKAGTAAARLAPRHPNEATMDGEMSPVSTAERAKASEVKQTRRPRRAVGRDSTRRTAKLTSAPVPIPTRQRASSSAIGSLGTAAASNPVSASVHAQADATGWRPHASESTAPTTAPAASARATTDARAATVRSSAEAAITSSAPASPV
mmetsp:Transcript_18116/g.48740  ORF Transcript_18116/g.48740 Transcript_18116/m.48740 type:complete len:254 (+) Transcript_18116:148-909(+)